MIPMLIEEAIKIKMKNKHNPDIISDYELSYACGYAAKLVEIDICDDLAKLREKVLEAEKNYVCRDYTEENLFKMIELYSVSGNAPEADKVKELMLMGNGKWDKSRL